MNAVVIFDNITIFKKIEIAFKNAIKVSVNETRNPQEDTL